MKRILVGVDGSPASLKAVELAADLVKKCNAQLSLLTVVSRSPPAVDAGYEEYARIEHIRSTPASSGRMSICFVHWKGSRAFSGPQSITPSWRGSSSWVPASLSPLPRVSGTLRHNHISFRRDLM
jgi:hypothetical protein